MDYFKWDLYEVLIHSQFITYNKWRLAEKQKERERETSSTDDKECAALDRVSNKMYFSQLKKVHSGNLYQFKTSLDLQYLFYFTLLSDSLSRWGKHHYLSQIALYSNQPNSMGKIINFTTQNTGVAGLLPLFMLDCLHFCVTLVNLTYPSKTPKSHHNTN